MVLVTTVVHTEHVEPELSEVKKCRWLGYEEEANSAQNRMTAISVEVRNSE